MFRKIGIALALLSGAAVVASARPAPAEESFEVRGGRGEIALEARGAWHVNQDYPWKAVVGDATFDKSKFVFTEKSAKLMGLPAGKAHLRGAVCNGPQCVPFTKEIEIR